MDSYSVEIKRLEKLLFHHQGNIINSQKRIQIQLVELSRVQKILKSLNTVDMTSSLSAYRPIFNEQYSNDVNHPNGSWATTLTFAPSTIRGFQLSVPHQVGQLYVRGFDNAGDPLS